MEQDNKEADTMKKKAVITASALIILVLAHKPMALASMYLVDTIGQATGTNTIELIDALNSIYYL